MKLRGFFLRDEPAEVVGPVEVAEVKERESRRGRASGVDGDLVSERMMESVHGGPLDPERTREALGMALEAFRKQAEKLRGMDYGKMGAKELAQTMAYTGKVMDEVYRLSEFAAGRADSRVEVGGMADLLQYLSDEQVTELSGWVEAGKGRAVEKKPRGELLQ